MSQKRLEGKVALVTGASSGMGRATALTFASEGAIVVCCDLRAEANPSGYERDLEKSTVDVIIENGGSAVFQRVDISNFEQVEAAFARTEQVRQRLSMISTLSLQRLFTGRFVTDIVGCLTVARTSRHSCQLRRPLGAVQKVR